MKIVSFLIFAFIMACSQGNSDAKFDAVAIAEELTEEIPIARQSTPPPPPAAEVIDVKEDQKIIKTARLVFESNDMEATHKTMLQLVTKHKGFVQNDNSGKDYNRIYKNLTVRIPTKNFQSFIDEISEGISFFDQRTISRQDVSEEFIDLQARLKAKQKLETRYLELLKKAKTVKEMLDIERELSKIREEIEAKQGRLQYLENKVSLSTVTIEFYKITAQTGVTQSYGQKIVNALQGGWNGISVFFLGVLYLWPLIIVAIIVVIILRKFLKRKKRK
ncbi:MAG: hypothetical protein CL526_11010 [Aequorivita sp.]|nr:hypothetical protein [Aequorivita sp.]|tara:strand:- start:101318 stop:102145 length:828 start_codon:yes stop_codon:yes gene_type:complete